MAKNQAAVLSAMAYTGSSMMQEDAESAPLLYMLFSA
jgi:hypothetical protein